MVPAKTDRVHDLGHAGGLEGNRLRQLALQICIYQTIQIHHMIESLHVEQIGRFQCRIPIEHRANFSRNFSIAGASAESAFSVCGTPRKGANENDAEGQRGKLCVPAHALK
jgi:hypothetical protein